MSILRNVFFLNKDLFYEGVKIPVGTSGHEINEEYLKQSNFSPDDYEELLRIAAQAKAQGLLYIDFKATGKRLVVHPRDVF